MSSEIDKLLRVIKEEIGYQISEKNNKYEYDLKYVYNVIDKNMDVENYSQLFIIWCFIKTFGKIKAFELLNIPFDNTENLTILQMQKMAQNAYKEFKMENSDYYYLYKSYFCDQIIYLKNQNLKCGIITDILSDTIKLVTINDEMIISEIFLDRYDLKTNVISLIKYIDVDNDEFL